MPSKRKKSKPFPRKKVPSRLIPLKAGTAGVPTAPDLSRFSPYWPYFLLGVVVLLWVFCRAANDLNAEKIFLIMGLFMGASFFLNLTSLKNVLVLVGLGWILAAIAIGTNLNFSFAYSFLPKFTIATPITLFAIGMGLVLAFWRFLPPADPSQDISKGWARFWFWVILAVAAYFRFYKVHEAVGCYWDDTAVGIIDPRGILEFHERPMLMPIGNREPFYSYFLAGLWALMPDAYAIFVHRLGGGLVDLVGIWLFYLLGKEVGGRRVGLVAAALGAVSKPMIIGDIMGATQVTVPMAVALLLLMTFRLFKKPDWKHFIYWGLALGFAPYNYTSVRPWLLFLVTAVFVWIWAYAQKGPKGKDDMVLGWGTLFAWAFAFLAIHKFLPKGNPLLGFLSQGWVGIVLMGLLGFLFLKSRQSSQNKDTSSLVPRYFLGVALAALIIYPLATNPLLGVHPAGLSIFHDPNSLKLHVGTGTFKIFFDKVLESLKTLFISGEDRGDMNLADDAFFDYHFIPIFIFGWMTVLVKPNWTKGFLLMAALVGISPRILSTELHSGMLIAGVAPLAVLAGMGVQQLYSAAKTAFPNRAFGYLASLPMAAYLVWAMTGIQEKVFNQYFAGDRVEKTVSRQVIEYSSRARVFIADFPLFISPVTQTLFNQGYDFFSLKATNPIHLKEGESSKDVVVILSLGDKADKAKIDEQFPKNVSWEVINLYGWPDKRPVCWRGIIPASEINEKSNRLFYYQRVPATNWTRDYLVGRHILGYGEIEMEESVPTPYAPVPPAMGGRMVNLRGDLNLPAAGPVDLRVRTNDFVNFKVDGRQLLYLNPDWAPQVAQKRVELSAGTHHVEYDIWLQHEQTVPQIMMSIQGAPEKPLQ